MAGQRNQQKLWLPLWVQGPWTLMPSGLEDDSIDRVKWGFKLRLLCGAERWALSSTREGLEMAGIGHCIKKDHS